MESAAAKKYKNELGVLNQLLMAQSMFHIFSTSDKMMTFGIEVIKNLPGVVRCGAYLWERKNILGDSFPVLDQMFTDQSAEDVARTQIESKIQSNDNIVLYHLQTGDQFFGFLYLLVPHRESFDVFKPVLSNFINMIAIHLENMQQRVEVKQYHDHLEEEVQKRTADLVHEITVRKQAVEALRASQQLIKETEQIGNVGGWQFDIVSKQQIWTDEVYRIHEVDRNFQPTVDNGISFYTADSKPIIERAVEQAITQGEPFDVELEITTAQGNHKWVHVIGKTDLLQQRVYGFFQDISDRKQTEFINLSRLHLLQFAEKNSLDDLLEETLNQVEDLTHSLIGFYHYVEADQKTLWLQNWSTRTKRDFCHAEGKGSHYNIDMAGVWVDCIRERRPIIHNNYESLIHKKGLPPGHARVIRELVVPVVRNEKIVAVLGVGNKPTEYTNKDLEQVVLLADLAWDITEHKRMQESLLRNESLMNATQQLMKVGGWEWNVEKQTMYWTDEVYRIHGLDKNDFISTPSELFTKSLACYETNDRPIIQKAFDRCCEYGEQYSLEFPFTTAHGRKRWISASGSPIRMGEKITSVIGTIIDITDQKKSEETVRQTQKMESIGTLAGGIAHDFNNLLGAMLGNASLAKRRITPEHPASKNIERTIQAIERAAVLTKQMLAYAGKGRFQIVTIDLNAVVNEHLDLLRASLSKNISITLHRSSEPVLIKGDVLQIEQIVMNVIVNAGEAIGEKRGNIVIEISQQLMTEQELIPYGTSNNQILPEGEYALFRVSDNGSGMNSETLSKIFEPFFSTKFIGRGLGLSAVLGIIRGHNGGITVESIEGEGTTFRILMPIMNPNLRESESPNKKLIQNSAGINNILVIDDENSIVDVITEILETKHYHHRSFTDPEEGIALYRQQWRTIDLVILDYAMPQMNGIEALAALRAINPSVKVIINSGYSEEEINQLTDGIPAAAFIQKPNTPEDLLRVVNQVLTMK